MNFIETVFESIQKGIKQVNGEIPYDIETYVIGSGSNFIVHKNISNKMARKIYENYKKKLGCLGKKRETKDFGSTILECWSTLESTSGTTYTFMFRINEVIEHNPNDVIDEWNKYKNENSKIFETI